MNATHGHCSLYLCPDQPAFCTNDLASFTSALQAIGLLAKKIEAKKTRQYYFTGDRYLDYIAYLGCAPSIQFEASGNNENFCFIKIHQQPKAELIYSRKRPRAPHCPNCNKPVKNWADKKTASSIYCDLCDSTSSIEKFNWRKTAGYAQLFIEITDIFPKEAIPQQSLLDKLKSISGVDWQYFYYCQ